MRPDVLCTLGPQSGHRTLHTDMQEKEDTVSLKYGSVLKHTVYVCVYLNLQSP